MHAHMNACMHARMHARTHAHTHTHTQTHTRNQQIQPFEMLHLLILYVLDKPTVSYVIRLLHALLQDTGQDDVTRTVPLRGTSVDPDGFSDRSSNATPPVSRPDKPDISRSYSTSVDPELSDDSLDSADITDAGPSTRDETVIGDTSAGDESTVGASSMDMTQSTVDSCTTSDTICDKSADSLTGDKTGDLGDDVSGSQKGDGDDDDSLDGDDKPDEQYSDSFCDSETSDAEYVDSLTGDEPDQKDDIDESSHGDDSESAPGDNPSDEASSVDSLTGEFEDANDIEEMAHSEVLQAGEDLGQAEADWIEDTVEFSRRFSLATEDAEEFAASSQLRLQQFAATLQNQIAKQEREERAEEMALEGELAGYVDRKEAKEHTTERDQHDEKSETDTSELLQNISVCSDIPALPLDDETEDAEWPSEQQDVTLLEKGNFMSSTRRSDTAVDAEQYLATVSKDRAEVDNKDPSALKFNPSKMIEPKTPAPAVVFKSHTGDSRLQLPEKKNLLQSYSYDEGFNDDITGNLNEYDSSNSSVELKLQEQAVNVSTETDDLLQGAETTMEEIFSDTQFLDDTETEGFLDYKPDVWLDIYDAETIQSVDTRWSSGWKFKVRCTLFSTKVYTCMQNVNKLTLKLLSSI